MAPRSTYSDTPANARTFVGLWAPADAAFPQVRLLAPCELGTHAVCGLAIKPIRHGETTMLGQLLEDLGHRMLLIWDRGFFGFDLIDSVWCPRGPPAGPGQEQRHPRAALPPGRCPAFRLDLPDPGRSPSRHAWAGCPQDRLYPRRPEPLPVSASGID